MFKRLSSVLILILLTSAASARPTRTSYSPAAELKPELCSGFSDPRQRLDFGTVVRDTADGEGQSVAPGCTEMPFILQQRMSPGIPVWISFLTRAWASLLLVLR